MLKLNAVGRFRHEKKICTNVVRKHDYKITPYKNCCAILEAKIKTYIGF